MVPLVEGGGGGWGFGAVTSFEMAATSDQDKIDEVNLLLLLVLFQMFFCLFLRDAPLEM